MFTVRIGSTKMARRQNYKRLLQCMLVMLPAVILIIVVLQRYSSLDTAELTRGLSKGLDIISSQTKSSKQTVGPCFPKTECPEDHFSFLIQSGAANVVGPKICIENSLALGTSKNNAGYGINVVIINGKTGEVIKTNHFNMYSGDVKPLIELLKSIEKGSVVLMASYDDPSTKLNEDARKLITELGSSVVQTLGFRDNWVFVGGKGAAVKSNFEKHLKNDRANNKYDNWPELIELQGCIPKYLE